MTLVCNNKIFVTKLWKILIIFLFFSGSRHDKFKREVAGIGVLEEL